MLPLPAFRKGRARLSSEQELFKTPRGFRGEFLKLRRYRINPMAQMRSQIFRQTKQIEEARVTPLPTKFVKCDGTDASRCAIKASAVIYAVLP